jgi:hypothetical protein
MLYIAYLLSTVSALAAVERYNDQSSIGPIHEAIAQPVDGSEAPSTVVRKRPVAPLHDAPAAVKPSTPPAIWIPGYWGWDNRAADFVWVTGVWRIPPPGMRWVPGYWTQKDDNWQWVRGFWFLHDQPRLRYLPPPPSPNDEPELDELDDDQFAVRGYWTHAGGQYVWSRGFKARRKQGWQWIPSRYTWTPAGSVYLPGYWDNELKRRGLIFGPVPAAPEGPASTAGATLRAPKLAIDLNRLSEVLIACPQYGHYYVDPAKAGVGDLTISISELARSRAFDRPLTVLSSESVPRIAQNAESVRLLAIQRWKFESSAEDTAAGAPLAFYLPTAAEPLDVQSRRVEPGESASEYLPGVSRRRVPGASRRSVPGISGRVVPGVDTSLPGAIGPGDKAGKQ